MNTYISSQINNMIVFAKTFNQSCRLAAYENDGEMSKEETSLLKKIEKATNAYIKELERIK